MKHINVYIYIYIITILCIYNTIYLWVWIRYAIILPNHKNMWSHCVFLTTLWHLKIFSIVPLSGKKWSLLKFSLSLLSMQDILWRHKKRFRSFTFLPQCIYKYATYPNLLIHKFFFLLPVSPLPCYLASLVTQIQEWTKIVKITRSGWSNG